MGRLTSLLVLASLAACGGADGRRVSGAALAPRDGAVNGGPDGRTPEQRVEAGTASADSGSARDASAGAPLACNGHTELCSRRFDEVVFAATHNAHAAQEYGYSRLNANQRSGIMKQLADGIRCLLMDVYDRDGENALCHGPCELASTRHIEALGILERFLEQHPHEVVSIIYEDAVSTERIAADFATASLDQVVYSHPSGAPWPTLGQMVETGKRLVVMLERGRSPPAWLHHVWREAWDTPYEFRSRSDFVCDLNRGSRDNALYLVNHWVSGAFGLPNAREAQGVNGYDVLYARAKGCWEETGSVPNFLAVDFYEHGDLFRVVDVLNGF